MECDVEQREAGRLEKVIGKVSVFSGVRVSILPPPRPPSHASWHSRVVASDNWRSNVSLDFQTIPFNSTLSVGTIKSSQSFQPDLTFSLAQQTPGRHGSEHRALSRGVPQFSLKFTPFLQVN